jgi:hypothetical protein
MTQISRPFQIALLAVVLLAAVWFVALRGHSSASSNEASAPAPAASSAASQGAGASVGSAASKSAAGPGGASSSSQGSSTYHGSAPGVDGLTRAIAKARGAVTESEQHAKALQQKSAEAAREAQAPSSSATAGVHHAATTGGTLPAKHSTTKTHAGSSLASTKSAASKAASNAATGKPTVATTAGGIPVLQARVEGELKQGKVAALLFWNPKGAVDKTVRRELQAAGGRLHGKLAISVARSSEVGLFGSFTRSVQVYGTPTILLVNHAGKTASVTGLTDVFSIEQAVREVKQAK